MTPEQAKWPHQDASALNIFYGDPLGTGGEANPKWEAGNIGYWKPPYPKGLRIHRRCHQAFTDAFTDALQTLGHDYIMANRLDISGGAYNYRVERGGSRLSVHAWGCAIDMDPAHNPFPARWRKGMIDPKFCEILEKHGFTWRGRNADIDPMHFQLANRG